MCRLIGRMTPLNNLTVNSILYSLPSNYFRCLKVKFQVLTASQSLSDQNDINYAYAHIKKSERSKRRQTRLLIYNQARG